MQGRVKASLFTFVAWVFDLIESGPWLLTYWGAGGASQYMIIGWLGWLGVVSLTTGLIVDRKALL